MTRTLIATLLTIVGLSTAGQTAKAEHIDNLAHKLQGQSRDLYWEFRHHYRHTREYRHLISDSAEMYKLAGHVHDIAHHAGSLVHLRSDLKDLDRLFHHIEDLVDDIEHDAHFHHGGHIHGSTRHVRHLLHDMEDTLHHLLDDVNELVRRQSVPFHQHRAAPRFQPTRPSAPVGQQPGFGFSFGGKGKGFSFRVSK